MLLYQIIYLSTRIRDLPGSNLGLRLLVLPVDLSGFPLSLQLITGIVSFNSRLHIPYSTFIIRSTKNPNALLLPHGKQNVSVKLLAFTIVIREVQSSNFHPNTTDCHGFPQSGQASDLTL